MIVRRISTGANLPSGFPFALAASVDGVSFISGMPALDSDGNFVAGSFEDEADLAWHNVVSIAETAGHAVADIVFVQCALADIGWYADLNAWWLKTFPEASSAPARFTFQAGALPFGAKIEFQAVAAAGG